MASSTSSITTPSSLIHFSPPKTHHNNKNNFFFTTHNKSSFQPLISYHTLSKTKTLNFQNQIHVSKKPRKLFQVSAVSSEDGAVIQAETTQEIVSSTSGDDGASNVISILLFIAFVALSILTIGVIYIAVTDFLTKREKEKFEKEEAAKKKKSGKKVRSRAKAGPRGFGQKIDEDDFDD